MIVSEAISSRFSARAFLPQTVSLDVLERILDKARWAPSGGNLQPWHVHALCGAPLKEMKSAVAVAARKNPRGEEPEYHVYPAKLAEPFRSRRYQCGEDLYAALGIPREDKAARLKQFARNLQAFDAPVVLFFSIERFMGRNQWAHLGMFMQTIMLLAREEGLHTCPQEAWSVFHSTVGQQLGLPGERMFYCGMALGYADMEHPVNQWRTRRADLSEFAKFSGFQQSEVSSSA